MGLGLTYLVSGVTTGCARSGDGSHRELGGGAGVGLTHFIANFTTGC
jgi:hypothetical protein